MATTGGTCIPLAHTPVIASVLTSQHLRRTTCNKCTGYLAVLLSLHKPVKTKTGTAMADFFVKVQILGLLLFTI